MNLVHTGNPYLEMNIKFQITDAIKIGAKSSGVSTRMLNGCQELIRWQQPLGSTSQRLETLGETDMVNASMINLQVLVPMPKVEPISIGNEFSELSARAIKGCTDIIQWQHPEKAIFRRLDPLIKTTKVKTNIFHRKMSLSMPKPDAVNICKQSMKPFVTSTKPHLPARKQSHKTMTMIQQPAVHIMDTKTFFTALAGTMKLPQYKKLVFQLMFKCLNIDCENVQQLIYERNQALNRSKHLEERNTKELEDAWIYYNAELQKQNDTWQKYHQSKKDQWAHRMEEQRINRDKNASTIRMESNWHLQKEKKNKEAAEARVKVLEGEQSEWQDKVREHRNQASTSRDQLIQSRVSRKADFEVLETKIQFHKDLCEKQRRICGDLSSQVKSLEIDKHNVIMKYDGDLIREKNKVEETKSEIKHKDEVAQLLRDRLQRKETSEAKKDSKITELTQQLEKSLEAQSELEDVKKQNARLIQELNDLKIHIQSFKVSEQQTEIQLTDLSREIEEIHSAPSTKPSTDLIREIEEIHSAPETKPSSIVNHEPTTKTEPLPSNLQQPLPQAAKGSELVQNKADSWDDDFYNIPSTAEPYIPAILKSSPASLINGNNKLETEFGTRPIQSSSTAANTKSTHRSWPSISSTTSSTLTEATEPVCDTNHTTPTNPLLPAPKATPPTAATTHKQQAPRVAKQPNFALEPPTTASTVAPLNLYPQAFIG